MTNKEKDNIYIKGYQKTPEKVKIADVSAKLASKVLNKENWSQHYLPKK